MEQGIRVVESGKPVHWQEAKALPVPGIYVVRNQEGDIICIGESTSLKERYDTHSGKNRFSALRRHIATEILMFYLKTQQELGIPSKDCRRAFLTDDEDRVVDEYFSKCLLTLTEVNLGRRELEEILIK